MTNIEWTHLPGYQGEVWNPVTGCTKVSPGCAHCYAEMVDHRYDHDKVGKLPWAFPASRGGRGVTLHPGRLDKPLHWKKPRCIFVNSMSDLFHEDVPFEFIDWVFAVMALCPQHIFQVLTKRPERMLAYITEGGIGRVGYVEGRAKSILRGSSDKPVLVGKTLRWPLPNVWLGVSAENQLWADRRIPDLIQTPAAVRFVSLEPLLGPVDLTPWLPHWKCIYCGHRHYSPNGSIELEEVICGCGKGRGRWEATNAGPRRLHWVITGGESGGTKEHPRRPADPQWFRDIRDQCIAAGVPYFHKQGNHNLPGHDRLLDGRTWEQWPLEVGE